MKCTHWCLYWLIEALKLWCRFFVCLFLCLCKLTLWIFITRLPSVKVLQGRQWFSVHASVCRSIRPKLCSLSGSFESFSYSNKLQFGRHSFSNVAPDHTDGVAMAITLLEQLDTHWVLIPDAFMFLEMKKRKKKHPNILSLNTAHFI